MKPKILPLLFLFAIAFSSCSVSSHSMRTPNYHMEFYKSDFEYSSQVEAEATAVKVFGIDWRRLFRREYGTLGADRFSSPDVPASGNVSVSVSDPYYGALSAVIPVLGTQLNNKVGNYALYELMEENPGYDLVIYPQYKSKKFVFPLIFSKETVTVKARLGKIKE